jgi:hypothetical protein
MGRLVPILATVLLVVVSGCGQANKPSNKPASGPVGPAAAMKHRLMAHGYSVSGDDRKPPHRPYEQTFSVDRVDWTSPRAFSVSVFIFSSAAKAQAHTKRTAASVGNFPKTNRSKLVGRHLFVATELGSLSQCSIVNGTVHCPPTPAVPVADFEKVISIAEG